MEIPYEIRSILGSNSLSNNDYIILEPSLFKYFNEEEKFIICSLINDLGELSNNDRHLSFPITSFASFINDNSNIKKIILKCINELIIGFIYLEEKPILLRNDYNLNYFYKNLILISDFFIMRNYRRMNYGKELFDKVIYMTNIKPVLMAYEFPNKALMNFLEKNYGIGNPIYQLNNIITFYNYKDEKFNKYLDDYHRIIDVNKMEDDIDNYRKWSPLNNDYYKRFNSDNSYRNIFPLKFNNNNKYNQYRYIKNNNNRYNNIENNYINNNRKKDRNNISKENFYSFNRSQNGRNNNKNQFNLIDKKNIYGKLNNMKKSTPIPLAIKDILSNSAKEKDLKYYNKFTDYYLNQNKNNINNHHNNRYERNTFRDNYYNYMNDEDRYIRNIYKSQKDNEDRLNMSVNKLNERIKNNSFKTPIRNKNNYDIYYRKNRSFATIFDSIENNKEEENNFIEYKKYKKLNEFID